MDYGGNVQWTLANELTTLMGYGGDTQWVSANELANLMGYGPTLCGDHFRLLDMSANSQFNILYAEMSEWSIVQSWNGCVQQCTPGSNPGLCANRDNVEPENKAIYLRLNIVKENSILNSLFVFNMLFHIQ